MPKSKDIDANDLQILYNMISDRDWSQDQFMNKLRSEKKQLYDKYTKDTLKDLF